jgi:hypothetical protein
MSAKMVVKLTLNRRPRTMATKKKATKKPAKKTAKKTTKKTKKKGK